MKWIYICSPLSGDIQGNIRKAIGYCKIAEPYGMPIAPHTIFTQFLDDTDLKQREKGMAWGMELLKCCEELWVFGEPSTGMQQEIDWWINFGWKDHIKYFDKDGKKI